LSLSVKVVVAPDAEEAQPSGILTVKPEPGGVKGT
jgi:hypothetical protein